MTESLGSCELHMSTVLRCLVYILSSNNMECVGCSPDEAPKLLPAVDIRHQHVEGICKGPGRVRKLALSETFMMQLQAD